MIVAKNFLATKGQNGKLTRICRGNVFELMSVTLNENAWIIARWVITPRTLQCRLLSVNVVVRASATWPKQKANLRLIPVCYNLVISCTRVYKSGVLNAAKFWTSNRKWKVQWVKWTEWAKAGGKLNGTQKRTQRNPTKSNGTESKGSSKCTFLINNSKEKKWTARKKNLEVLS